MSTGISIYLGTDFEKNEAILKKAAKAGMSYIFTSLHIPEEQLENYKISVEQLLKKCHDYKLILIADISPTMLKKFNYQSYDELTELGFDYIRLDFGFSNDEIIRLSKIFHIALNASTISDKDLIQWQAQGVGFTRLIACHNFYPKPLTGLSLQKVKQINQKLKTFGFKTLAFVAGDKDYRGPLFQGLPTVEEHRNQHVLLNLLQLIHEANSDAVLIGDIDVSNKVWEQIQAYNAGFIALRATIQAPYDFVKNSRHHDRPDSSEYVIRSQESRYFPQTVLTQERLSPTGLMTERKKGAIFISNHLYLRYAGELEIARQDLAPDKKVNVIGSIHPDDQRYLPYIKDGFGFVLI